MDSAKLSENLDSLIHDLRLCKQSMEMLLSNLVEPEAMNYEKKVDWPTVLNSLRIISTNLISISNFLRDKSDRRDDNKRELLLALKTSIVVPKHYSEEVNPELRDSTDGRICVFNQEIIPNTLRTKLIPALEEEENRLNQTAREIQQLKTSDKSFKKAIDEASKLMGETIDKLRRDMDSKQTSTAKTYNLSDTMELLGHIHYYRMPQMRHGQRMQM